jgi:cysteine desulfurase/selenocysteine lyase
MQRILVKLHAVCAQHVRIPNVRIGIFGIEMSEVEQNRSTPQSLDSGMSFGAALRKEFPVFSAHGHEMAYLDTAASAQKPQSVIDRLSKYLAIEHANIHRGAYKLSANATEMYDQARGKVASFVGAKSVDEIVFVRGATEAVNLVAYGIQHRIRPGDVILVTLLEHHSNFVPWQMLASRTGARVEYVEITDQGALDLADLRAKLNEFRPKLLAVTSVSNALGTIVPLKDVIAAAHEVGTEVLVDGAQGILHLDLDVAALDIDYLVASGHKMYGPTGIGFLYGKKKLLDAMHPFQGGGDMIAYVAVEGSSWAEVPRRFEAGTPAIGEAIALGTAIEFIQSLGRTQLRAYEDKIFDYGFDLLAREPHVKVYGPRNSGGEQVSILSFTVDGVHPHDISTILDSYNVQIRAGHHCAMPLLKRLGVQATARASIGAYSTKEDFDRLVVGIREGRKIFAR